jgi:hypothetical protein
VVKLLILNVARPSDCFTPEIAQDIIVCRDFTYRVKKESKQ